LGSESCWPDPRIHHCHTAILEVIDVASRKQGAVMSRDGSHLRIKLRNRPPGGRRSTSALGDEISEGVVHRLATLAGITA